MSDIERYKELFLNSAFADGNTTIRKWDGDLSPWPGLPSDMNRFCPIQPLGGGRKPSQPVVKAYSRFREDLIWGYCSLTPFCGFRFCDAHFLFYEERDRIIAILKWRELGDTDLIKPPRIIVSPAGGIICSVIELDVLRPDLNEPQNAGAIAQSLGFAAWPHIPMFEFPPVSTGAASGETVRATFDAAVLFRMLYRPSLPAGASRADIVPLLDAIASEAVGHAGRNRSFFNPDVYFPKRLRRAVERHGV